MLRVLHAVDDIARGRRAGSGRRFFWRDDEVTDIRSARMSWSLLVDRVGLPGRRRCCPWAASTLTWPEEGADVFQTEPGGGQRGRIDLHAHGGLFRAADDHLADAFHLAEPLADDLIGVLRRPPSAAACRRSSPGS